MFLIWILAVISSSLVHIVVATKLEGKISVSSKVVTSKMAALKITCSVDSLSQMITSPFLAIYQNEKLLLSVVDNDNSISSTIQFASENSSSICSEKRYSCRFNSEIVDETSVTFGEPPPRIDQHQFKCVSENLDYLSCHFPYLDTCWTSYSLMKRSDVGYSSCKLRESNGSMYFDSHDGGGCTYNPDDENLEFVLRTSNLLGSSEVKIRVNNFDIVRPASVYSLNWTPGRVIWKSVKNLGYLGRSFVYQFRAACYQNNTFVNMNSTYMMFNVALSHFPPCTKIFSVRLRIVPEYLLVDGEELWSEWRSIEIKQHKMSIVAGTPMDRFPLPNHNVIKPVHTVYSSKGRGDHISLELYWIFSSDKIYNISMESISSQRQDPASMTYEPTHGTALYKNVQPKVHKINTPKRSIKIIPHDESHRPKFKRIVNNNGSFEVSWFPVKDHQNLVSYSILHCHYTVTDFCQNAVVLLTLPPTETSYNIYSKVTLNFAIAANYRNFSSSLSWIRCTVHPAGSAVGPPQFSITDVTETSLTVRMETPCPDRSFYESLEVEVRAKADDEVFRGIFESHEEFVRIPDLVEDTRYEVIVTAYNESRYRVGRTSAIARTGKKATPISSSIYVYVGILLGTILLHQVSIKVKRVMNIDVELPPGIMEIYDAKVFSEFLNSSVNDVDEECVAIVLPTILEEEDLSAGHNSLEELEDNTACNHLNDYVDVGTLLHNTCIGSQTPVKDEGENPVIDGYVTVDVLKSKC